jgi:Zn finger protein HypA/HybF involved in hydrogenase expression
MHDLHEADRILKIILEHGKKHKLKKITKVLIGLGSIEEHGNEILADNLKFNIKLLAKDTMAEKLDVKIEKTKTDSWIINEIEGE